MLDAKIVSTLEKIIHNSYFKKRVNPAEQKAQVEDRFLRGRQIAGCRSVAPHGQRRHAQVQKGCAAEDAQQDSRILSNRLRESAAASAAAARRNPAAPCARLRDGIGSAVRRMEVRYLEQGCANTWRGRTDGPWR